MHAALPSREFAASLRCRLVPSTFAREAAQRAPKWALSGLFSGRACRPALNWAFSKERPAVEFLDFLSFATGAGCVTAIILKILSSTLGARSKLREQDLRTAQDRCDQQEQRIAELTRQNEQLHEQLAWHLRLLESHERSVGQPASGNRSEGTLSVRAQARNYRPSGNVLETGSLLES